VSNNARMPRNDHRLRCEFKYSEPQHLDSMPPRRKAIAPPTTVQAEPAIPNGVELSYRGSQSVVATKSTLVQTEVEKVGGGDLTGSTRKRKRNGETGDEESGKKKRKGEKGVRRTVGVVSTREEGIGSNIRVTAGRKAKSVKRVKEEEQEEQEEEVVKEKEGEEGVAGVKEEVVGVGGAKVKTRVIKKAASKKKTVVKKNIKQEDLSEEEEAEGNLLDPLDGEKPKKTRKPRKPKAPMLPFAPRTPSLPYYLGAHVSMAKGVQNAIHNTLLIGGNSLALFLKSQRKWASPELTTTSITEFKALAVQNGYTRKRILPHGSYLINLAQKEPEKYKQAYDGFLDDLKRCEKLGIGLYNFHPGHTGALQTRVEAMERIAESLNRAHGETSDVVTLLENMAGHGSPPIIGSTLEDLRDIIASVKDKSRVGVCIDTCHAFAAGYDLRTHDTFSKFWEEFDRVVGAKYLKAMHLNDSKAPLGGRRDLHQHIGQGYLGLEAFRLVMNSERMKGIPLILETPMVGEGKSWAEEIKLLERLIGMRGDEEWFLEKAKELQELGRAERERVGDVVKRREEKVKKQGELKVKREKKMKDEAGEGVKVKVKVKSGRKTKVDVKKAGDGEAVKVKRGRKAKVNVEKGEEKEIKVRKRRVLKKKIPSDSELGELSESESEGGGCKH